ncbi:hypothetical protein [Vreelandella salicampi]|uniref:Uncharacterized protein n=1 Tax=Vreelandella salicampi TaxID=1449798 RepID=A0A7Z0LJU5_9GAMM|nr:hypothetical protein [Halomonas salicampi]NYS60329.1 hypothetical protein [Halomonas salicampi]
MDYTLAMEDELLKAFHDFKRGALSETSTAIIQNLLRLYHPPHITSVEQLKAIGVDDNILFQQLASQGLVTQTPQELAPRTRYKLLLSGNQTHYPATAVSGDSINSEFVMTLKPGEARAKAHEWLTALLADAKTVTVIDPYLFSPSGRKSVTPFFQLFPRKALTLFFNKLPQDAASSIKQICAEWKVKENTDPRYANVHDRYLLIDNSVEIVITSGIDYLFDTSKECTLLVRQKKA